jgi:hypothetical protein
LNDKNQNPIASTVSCGVNLKSNFKIRKMKTIRASMALIVIALTAICSCSKTDFSKPQSQNLASSNSNDQVHVCGEPFVYSLIDKNKTVQGTLSVSNDETNVFITISITGADYKMSKAELVVGDLTHMTAATDLTAWPKLAAGPNPPDYSQNFKPEVITYTFTIPAANYQDCFFVNAFAKIVKRDPNTHKVIASDFLFLQSDTKTSCKCWSTYIQYCKQDCPLQCGQLTTYTQGGYGAPNGGPHDYLYANFAAAFPNGVTIGSHGCADGHTLTLTTTSAITNNLPTGGTADVLDKDYTDEVPSKNVLVGQLVSLSLSVGFDEHDANFGQAPLHLSDMIIGSGDFQGMTVSAFLSLANDVIAGCNTNYTPTQVNSTADQINKNYDNGAVDNGFLVCPNN